MEANLFAACLSNYKNIAVHTKPKQLIKYFNIKAPKLKETETDQDKVTQTWENLVGHIQHTKPM